LLVKPADAAIKAIESAEILTGPNAKSENSYEQPNVVTAKTFDGAVVIDGKLSLNLPPLSFAALTVNVE